jgi:hypothetical protein
VPTQSTDRRGNRKFIVTLLEQRPGRYRVPRAQQRWHGGMTAV